MARPKGSKDLKKRKRKVFITGQQEREIVKDYNNGVPSLDIRNKYSISNAQLSNIRKSRNIKIRINHSDIKNWEIVSDFKSIKNTSGIYAIFFIWNYDDNNPKRDYKVNDIKCYIGSSVGIGSRLGSHKNELSKNKHFNKELQERYHDSEFSIKYAIIERCDEDKVMQKEREYLDKWNRCSLFNTWVATNEKDLRPFLEKAVKLDGYVKFFTWSNDKFYNGTPCKESNCVHKTGYTRMRIRIDGKGKTFTKHRIAYWEKHGEYPELVRHLCDNPKCYNAEHLAKGNHKDNMLDRRGSFPQEFEEIWLKYQADLHDISKYYEAKGRWKPNQDWYGKKVSYSVYDWEKKLGLREKYPDLVKNRISMLRSAHAAKGNETRKRNLNATPKV